MTKKKDLTYEENFDKLYQDMINYEEQSNMGMMDNAIKETVKSKGFTKTDLKNSQGGEIGTIVGVDIIAGNDDSELQPMVLGKNVEEAMQKIVTHLDKLNGIVNGLVMYQMKYNTLLASHFHISPFCGAPTTPSPTAVAAGAAAAVELGAMTIRDLLTQKANLVMFKTTYLNTAGGKYINSRYNNVN